MQATPIGVSYPWETTSLGDRAQILDIFPNISLEMLTICPEEDITITSTPPPTLTQDDWSLAFSLDGEAESSFITKGRPLSINIAPSTFTLFQLHDSQRSFSLKKKIATSMLSMRLSEQQLKYFLDVPECVNLDKVVCPHESVTLRTAQKTILHQMFNSTKHGMAHSLYLQSKGLELLSDFIESMKLQIHGTCCRQCEYTLNTKEIDAIQLAREIYKDNIIDPPCLPELSRLVGLNVTKLKRGFHAVYNTTPYACLREARMIKAGNLLASKDMNVSQVAWAVGYSNLSHFCVAFAKHYGANPKAFQMNSK